MTRKEVFFFGAIGGVMPILVTIISVDLSPIIDNPAHSRLATTSALASGLLPSSSQAASSR